MLDIIGVDAYDQFHLVLQFRQQPDLVVGLIARQDSGSVEILEHLTPEFEVKFALKCVDPFQNLVTLQFQILLRIKSCLFHNRALTLCKVYQIITRILNEKNENTVTPKGCSDFAAKRGPGTEKRPD